MPRLRYLVVLLALGSCRHSTAPGPSACRVALDRGMGFVVVPPRVGVPPGFSFQLSASGPAECLPARFFVAPQDTAILSVTPDGHVLAKRLGEGYARAYATDTTVQSAGWVWVVNVTPLDRVTLR